VLAQAGIVSQAVYGYTYISDCSRKVTLDSLCFVYRQLQDRFLYNTAGIAEQEGVFIASSERAIADMLYFNPKYHFDVLEMVDFQKVRSIQEEVGYL